MDKKNLISSFFFQFFDHQLYDGLSISFNSLYEDVF